MDIKDTEKNKLFKFESKRSETGLARMYGLCCRNNVDILFTFTFQKESKKWKRN